MEKINVPANAEIVSRADWRSMETAPAEPVSVALLKDCDTVWLSMLWTPAMTGDEDQYPPIWCEIYTGEPIENPEGWLPWPPVST